MLDGKLVLVTGATRGIGKAIALTLGNSGATVIGTATTESGADNVSKVFAENKISGKGMKLDVTDNDQVSNLVKSVNENFGSVDILVNNAGIIRRNDAVDFTEEDWDAVIDTNLKTLFFLSQAAAKGMIAQGSGKIINIASMLTFQGGIRVPSYTASKSGVGGLTKAMANEWAAKGVNVNAIAPGYIETNNTAALQADENRNRQIVERIPAGRWGKAEDIGGAAVFLASSAADYVNGHILAVDGGWLAR